MRKEEKQRHVFAQILLLASLVSGCTFEPIANAPPSPRLQDDSDIALDAGVPDVTSESLLDAQTALGGSSAEAGPPNNTLDSGEAADAGVSDASPRDATADRDASSAFDYTPSNFAGAAVPASSARVEVAGGDCTITLAPFGFSGACAVNGRTPLMNIVQSGGVDTAMITMGSLHIAQDGRLLIEGDRPVILVVRGDATIEGVLSVSASLERSGPGGGLLGLCGDGGKGSPRASPDAPPFDSSAGVFDNGASGGGGGGFGTAGGMGGDGARAMAPGGTPGEQNGNPRLTPIRGGCLGGAGGANVAGQRGAAGGAGGGIQISAADRLRVDGQVWAVGAGGGGGPRGAGAGGGGSGGGILLEGREVFFGAGARILANGGSGGEGGGGSPAGNDGEDGFYGSTMDASPALGGASFTPSGGDGGNGGAGSTPPEDGQTGSAMSGGGGGGGGGSFGRIRVNTSRLCSIESGALFSPAPTVNRPERCGL